MAAAPRRCWLLKSEPSAFSFADLLAAPGRRTAWTGIRNHQARNLLRDELQVGDGVLFYHSSSDPSGVAGLARVSRSARPDPTQFDPRSAQYDPRSRRTAPTWVEVEIEAAEALPRFVTLAELKAHPALARMLVVQRGSRLSVQPVRDEEWRTVLEIARSPAPEPAPYATSKSMIGKGLRRMRPEAGPRQARRHNGAPRNPPGQPKPSGRSR